MMNGLGTGFGNWWRPGPMGDWRGSGFNIQGRRNAQGYQTNIFGQPYGPPAFSATATGSPVVPPPVQAPFDTQQVADQLFQGNSVRTHQVGPASTNVMTPRDPYTPADELLPGISRQIVGTVVSPRDGLRRNIYARSPSFGFNPGQYARNTARPALKVGSIPRGLGTGFGR